MPIVEYQGKKYDTGFEFETLQEQVSGIMWQCMEYSDMKNVSREEIEELDEIWERTRSIKNNYALMDSLEKLFETQQYLDDLREELNKRFGGRDAHV